MRKYNLFDKNKQCRAEFFFENEQELQTFFESNPEYELFDHQKSNNNNNKKSKMFSLNIVSGTNQRQKIPDGFKNILKTIKKNSPGSNIDV